MYEQLNNGIWYYFDMINMTQLVKKQIWGYLPSRGKTSQSVIPYGV